MIKKTLALAGLSAMTLSANASLITVEHNITDLPYSGYVQIDIDGDGLKEINLASNRYVSVFNYDTYFTRSYSLIGDVIDASIAWKQGNYWPNPNGYVQDDLLYLAVRNTTIGHYYGYMTYEYHASTDTVSLRSYTYENSGAPITVRASTVPIPAASWLLGSAILFLAGIRRKK
ncbi:Uncharacterised protein [Halioglobus japonicus]|nr:Uncharacterised protein [Halioglobus japonicus]